MGHAYYIGIECIGQRQSIAVLSDASGRLIGALRINRGVALHTTPRELLRCHLWDLIQGVVLKAGLTESVLDSSTICIGLTGVTFAYDAQVDLPREIGELKLGCANLICTGDAEIIFAALAQKDTGSALICHMGSTGYATKRSVRWRFGGWGPLIGDTGSGYAMGWATLHRICEEYDAQDEPSILWAEVKAWLDSPVNGASTPLPEWKDASYRWHTLKQMANRSLTDSELRATIFAFAHAIGREYGLWAWRSIVSSFSVPLFRAYEKHDPQAKKIILRAAEHLAIQHTQVCDNAGVTPDTGPFVLYGGLLTHHSNFQQLVCDAVRAHWRGRNVKLPLPVTIHSPGALRPACGALMFALGHSTSANLRLPAQSIITSLLNQHCKGSRWEEELRND